MPKFHLRDLSGGKNVEKPRHLIQNKQLVDINDARWRDGKWVKRPGYSLSFDASPDGKVFHEFTDYIEPDGTKHLLGFTTEHVYRLTDPGWELRYTTGADRALNDKWMHTRLLDRHIITNGVDAPASTLAPDTANYVSISFDTSTDASGSTGLTISKAKSVATFNNRLLFANITESVDGANNLKLMYSEVNNYARFHTDSFVNIDDTGTDILNLVPLAFRRLAVYKEDMCAVLIDRGTPFFIQSIFADHVGLYAPKAVCPIPGGNFFVSNMGLYTFSPSSVDQIGSDRIWAEFYNNINDSSLTAINNTYCFFDRNNKEVYIIFASGASTTPDRFILINLQHNNWCTDDFDANSGFFDFRKTKVPKVYFTESTRVRLQGGTLDDAAAITPVIESKAFTVLPTEDNPSPPDVFEVIRVETDALPNGGASGSGGSAVSVLTSNTGSETPTVVDTQDITDDGEKMPYAALASAWGKYIAFRVTGFTEISEIVYWWQPGGNE